MLCCVVCVLLFFFFQAEDGIRDLVRSRGLGDVYKRQVIDLRDFKNLGGLDALKIHLEDLPPILLKRF